MIINVHNNGSDCCMLEVHNDLHVRNKDKYEFFFVIRSARMLHSCPANRSVVRNSCFAQPARSSPYIFVTAIV